MNKKVISTKKELQQIDNLSDFIKGGGRFNKSIIKYLPDNFKNEYFIYRARQIHGDKYDYSKTKYKGGLEKIIIICPIHGEFEIYALHHLTPLKRGCPKCGLGKMSYNQFVKKANKVHNDEYIYLFDENWWNKNYRGVETLIPIVCNKCNMTFHQSVHQHLQGKGCPECAYDEIAKKLKLSYQEFIKRANDIHGKIYQYQFDENWWDKNYRNLNSKIPIVCPKHGLFHQKAGLHLRGNGCPICNASKGELSIKKWLDANNINYITQFEVKIGNRHYYFDFYLPDFNMFIEYHGIQHYKFVPFFHKTYERFKERIEDDINKRQFAIENNYKLLTIPYWDFNEIETILKKELYNEN